MEKLKVPPITQPPLKTCKEMQIVQLTKSILPDTSNYAAQLYQRVNRIFLNYFLYPNMTRKVEIEDVNVILNPFLAETFRLAELKLHTECNSFASMLSSTTVSPAAKDYLRNIEFDTKIERNSNPIPAWYYISSAEQALKVCWYGINPVTETKQPKLYGNGMYFNAESNTGGIYFDAENKPPGVYQVALCWVLLGNPHAQQVVSFNRACELGCTSHYIRTKTKPVKLQSCDTTTDYDMLVALGSQQMLLPITKGEVSNTDQVVIFDPSHILPRFIVRFRIE